MADALSAHEPLRLQTSTVFVGDVVGTLMGGKQHLAGLDGLRGLTALVVTAFHAGYYFRLPVLQHGYLGVDFFFLLSGFVVALAYEQAVETGHWLLFTRKRFVRLFPMIVFGGFLGAALLDPAPSTFLKTTLLIPTMTGALIFPANSPIWSMLFEAAANALYAVMGRTTTRLWVFLAGAVSTVVLAFSLLIGGLNVGFQPANILLGLPRTLAPFLIGVVVYRYRARLPLELPVWVFSTLLVGAFALPHFMYLNGLLDPILTLVAFPAILIAAINHPPSPRVAAVCRLGGELSYPLYLTHWPILIVLSPWIVKLSLFGRVAAFVAFIVGLTTLAFVVLRLYEDRARRLLGAMDARIFRAKMITI